jgi:hypothetical protein
MIKIGDEVSYRVGGSNREPELCRAVVMRVNDEQGEVNLRIQASPTDGDVFNEVELERGYADRPRVQRGTGVGQWQPAKA